MNNVIFPAHIRQLENGNRSVQSCEEHCRRSADIAVASFKSPRLKKTVYLAALLHDMGKFKSAFKDYIERSANGEAVRRGSVKHTFCGVRYLFENYYDESDTYACITCEILAYAVGAHHGLFDCINESHESGLAYRVFEDVDGDREATESFLKCCADKSEIDGLFRESKDELTNLLSSELLPFVNLENDSECSFYIGLLVRLITSAVMEGDRRDTAEFMSDAVYPSAADQNLWRLLLARVEEKLEKFASDSPINKARRKISDDCREFATNRCGVYRLNVPTGGGKTLASLRFALAHAAKHGKRRVIFTSPLLSILDQNSKVIREMIEDDSLILEHHSNVVRQTDDTGEDNKNSEFTDNWSAPIIITTLVQLLNTMFDGRSSAVRRFHALSDAVIVIDEVQSVPHKLLSLFNLTVSFLADVCSSTVVLCSATQPCCETLEHPIRSKVEDIVPPNKELEGVFKRTEIIPAGSMVLSDVPKLADSILECADSLLIICNTKRESEELFKLLSNKDYALFHLSAAMCMAHREDVLKKVYSSLEEHSCVKTVCVATQVIEAGVDISFDSVIRFTAGMDSIIQAAGRCNRHGERAELGRVFAVQIVDENISRLPEIEEAKKATSDLLYRYEKSPESYGFDLSSDTAIKYYYNRLFSGRETSYFNFVLRGSPTLFSLLSENKVWMPEEEKLPMRLCLHQAFKSAGDMFSVFDNDTVDVIVRYREGDSVATELLSERVKYDAKYAKSLIDKAKNYTVSLYNTSIKKLAENGALISALDGAVLILDNPYYDDGTGVKTKLNEEDYGKCTLIL